MQLFVTLRYKLNYELTFLCHNFIRESVQLKDAIYNFFLHFIMRAMPSIPLEHELC